MTQQTTELYDDEGQRKYLNHAERIDFFKSTRILEADRQIFCILMLVTGCRISEALELTPKRIDIKNQTVIFRTLKHHKPKVAKKGILKKKTSKEPKPTKRFRHVPVPPWLIKRLLKIIPADPTRRIWSFCRRTGYRIIKSVANHAGIDGPRSSPKGLRHGFGVAHAEKNTALKVIKELMGHRSTKTTMIYLNIVGDEMRRFASRVWPSEKLLLDLDS